MKKLLSIIFTIILVSSSTIYVLAAEKFSENFSDPSKLSYFVFENDGFIVQDGAFVAKSITKYNAAYYGQYYESCVYEFDFKDYGGGQSTGGASIRVSSARYDVEVRSDGKGDDEKIVIWKGGPNKKASNTMANSGKGVPSIPVGSWVNIKIVLTKNTIKVYVANKLYVDYTDTLPYTSGGFGFRSSNSKIGYDNIKIYDVTDLNYTSSSVSSKAASSKQSSAAASSKAASSSLASSNTESQNASSQESIESSTSSLEASSAVSTDSQMDSTVSSEQSDSSSVVSSDEDSSGNSNLLVIILVAIIVVLIVIGALGYYFLVFKKKS